MPVARMARRKLWLRICATDAGRWRVIGVKSYVRLLRIAGARGAKSPPLVYFNAAVTMISTR